MKSSTNFSSKNNTVINSEYIQGQVNKYPQLDSVNQITIASNLYTIIQQQRKELLRKNLNEAQIKLRKSQADQHGKNQDKLNLFISKFTDNDIEKTNLFNQQVKRLRQSFKKKDQANNSQPKFEIFIRSEKQEKLEIQNRILQTQNQSLKKRISVFSEQLNKFALDQKKTRKDYQSLKEKVQKFYKQPLNKSDCKNQQLEQIIQEKSKLIKEITQIKKIADLSKDQNKKRIESYKNLVKFVKSIFEFSVEQTSQLKDVCNKLTNFGKSIKQQQEITLFKQKQMLASLKQYINNSNTIIQQLVHKYQELSQQHQFLKTTKESLQQQLDLINKETNKLSALYKQNQKLLKLERDAKKLLQKNFQEQNTKIKSLTDSLTNKEAQFSKLKKDAQIKIKYLEGNIQQLKEIKQKNQKQINRITSELAEKTNLTISLEKANKQLQKERTKLYEANKGLQQEVNTKDSIIKDLQRKLKQANGKITELTSIIDRLKNNNRQLNDQKEKLIKDNKNLQSDVRDLNKKLSQAKQKLVQSLQIPMKINKRLVGISSQIFLGQERLLSALTPEKSKQLDKQIDQILTLWRNQFNKSKFFNGSQVIPSQNVTWMVNTLQSYVKQIAYQTRLVYRYDRLSTVNFHQYIDKIPNLLVLVKITNGPIIGGFTVYEYDRERVQRPGKGFIFNLNYLKAYYVRNQPRLPVTSYDDYYMILGNAEIRIRCQQSKVFSNFGIANSTFENGTDLRTKFLDVKSMMNNELDVDTYEFYEVKFRA